MLFYDTYVFAHIKILCEAFYDTYPCTHFLTNLFMLHPIYIHTFFLEGFFCYLLTNTHILKNTFTLPIQHFVRHFMLYIFILCKAFSCYIYSYFARHFIQHFARHFIQHFARHFHAIYIHIYTYRWKVFSMLPRCKVFLMGQPNLNSNNNLSNMS